MTYLNSGNAQTRGLTPIAVSVFIFWQPIIVILLAIAGLNVPGLIVSSTVGCLLGVLVILNKRNVSYYRKIGFHAILIFILFGLIMASSKWSIGASISEKKLLNFMFAVVVPCMIIFLFSKVRLNSAGRYSVRPDNIRMKGIGLGFLIFSLLFVIFSSPSEVDSSRLSVIGIDNPIWVARYASAFFVVLLFRFEANSSTTRWMLMGLLSLLAIMILIGTNTRSVFLGLVCAILYIYSSRKRNNLISLGVVALILSAFLATIETEYLVRGYYSINQRLDFLNFFLEYPASAFTGVGLGSFGILFTGQSVYLYPHNIIIEIWFEMGIIALSVFLLLLFFAFVKCKRSEYKALLILFLVSALFSGDIVGNAPVFFLLTAIIAEKSFTA